MERLLLFGGFPSAIDWVEWEQAIGVAKDLNKPIFFLIHKTWCGACKGLKREFGSSPKTKELIELSKNFVMVNVEDDDEPEDEKYAPDGGYIPRIIFLGEHKYIFLLYSSLNKSKLLPIDIA
ncbi:hypothetical protein ANCCAN_22976 [Ancylostoma caninum]|uniref:Thioredoxin domain-containing protein n=1 Tax=Ancylostoma caninum TaxID=29170 RepID=A0A368FGF4_ANCCA|nr:hypothetical protein ANCCAN_22976 [Ancylostoma caninum]